jgi:hypothetical protein
MPNWCFNEVNIHGNSEELNKLLLNCISKQNNEEEFVSILEEYFPVPDDYENENIDPNVLITKYGSAREDEWCRKNWGTRSIEFDMEIEYSKDSMYAKLKYTSAWSPHIEGYVEISKRFPSLIFYWHYNEPCGGIFGVAKIQNGILVEDFNRY